MSVILDNLDKDKQLGVEYQEQFINEIIIDKRFADDILPLVKPQHFNNENYLLMNQILIFLTTSQVTYSAAAFIFLCALSRDVLNNSDS